MLKTLSIGRVVLRSIRCHMMIIISKMSHKHSLVKKEYTAVTRLSEDVLKPPCLSVALVVPRLRHLRMTEQRAIHGYVKKAHGQPSFMQ